MIKYILFAIIQFFVIVFLPSLLTQVLELFWLVASVLAVVLSVAIALVFAALLHGQRVNEELRVWRP